MLTTQSENPYQLGPHRFCVIRPRSDNGKGGAGGETAKTVFSQLRSVQVQRVARNA